MLPVGNLHIVTIVGDRVEQREGNVDGKECVVQDLVVSHHGLWDLDSPEN